jgi:hypothetical protein
MTKHMIGRGAIIAAVVVYLGVTVGCILNGPADSVAEKRTAERRPMVIHAVRQTGLPFRGVAMQLQRVDWMETEYRKSIDDIVDVGADTVMFVIDAHMENGGSTRIYLDMRLTPSPELLGSLIDYAKSKKLRVVLMPIVLLDRARGNEWRGTIKPDDWSEWWENYRNMLYQYSWIAEGHAVDLLVVGSELVSTESHQEEWRTTIAEVRKVFKGMITYSANWDHYREVPFWDQLDLLSMNSYYKLGDDHNVSVENIQSRWKEIQNNILSFQRTLGKPLVLLEVGWCSQRNAADSPWDYTQPDVPIDLDLQRKLYEGFFRSWHGVREFGGFMIWEWPPGDGGPTNRGYTPEAKPAEKVLRDWLAKPAWDVR